MYNRLLCPARQLTFCFWLGGFGVQGASPTAPALTRTFLSPCTVRELATKSTKATKDASVIFVENYTCHFKIYHVILTGDKDFIRLNPDGTCATKREGTEKEKKCKNAN